MPLHDIIDKRSEKLVDHINLILASTEAAGSVDSRFPESLRLFLQIRVPSFTATVHDRPPE